jgi:hypothetical protein
MMATFNFPPSSRYYGIETATITSPAGQPVRYLRRRFVPQPELFATLTEHVVAEGERLDNITAHYLADAEAFWRVADANRAMDPNRLTTPVGRRLRITLPEGIPGPSNA